MIEPVHRYRKQLRICFIRQKYCGFLKKARGKLRQLKHGFVHPQNDYYFAWRWSMSSFDDISPSRSIVEFCFGFINIVIVETKMEPELNAE